MQAGTISHGGRLVVSILANLVSWLVAPGSLNAQNTWVEVPSLAPPAAMPAARSVTFDTVRNRPLFLVLNAQWDLDLWTFDGQVWSALPSVGPKPNTYNSGCPAAFDSIRDRLVVHLEGIGETWEWNGTSWACLVSQPAPSLRNQSSMAFDPVRGRTILFGGSDALLQSFYPGEAWEWDGIRWSMGKPSQGRAGQALFFDQATRKVLMFGGVAQLGSTILFSTTEVYDGNSWQLLSPATRPSGRGYCGIVSNPRRGRTLLLAGWPYTNPGPESWEWTGTSWIQSQASQQLPWPQVTNLWYHPVQDAYYVIAYAGSVRQLWRLKDQAEWIPYGSGCAGSAGTPYLLAGGDWLPTLGGFFVMTVKNLPTGSAAVLNLGTSKTQWEGVPLPFDLSVIGMPNCSALAAGNLAFPIINVGGAGSVGMLVPNELGRHLYAQAIVLDASANLLGVTVSNAGECVIGY